MLTQAKKIQGKKLCLFAQKKGWNFLKKTFFLREHFYEHFFSVEPELVCSFVFNKNKPCLILALFFKGKKSINSGWV